MPRIPQSIIDEILDRVPIEQVVGRKVQLKKAGREWRGLSCFNSEKTPSLYANSAKRMFFDFSSGKSGNAITFVMETEGLSFREAVERLAADAGVKLPKDDSPQARAQERAYRESRDALDEALEYFGQHLAATKAARDYLDERDLGSSTLKAWDLGFAPDKWDGLLSCLRGKKIDMAAIEASGLIVSGPDIERPHDFFRGRVMFPIRDARGKLVSFGGRIIGKGEPKYLNGRETAVFDKGRVLFGLDRATEAIRKTGVAVVGEGYLDVIRPHQAGFKHIVAPMGTALQDTHLHSLWRLAPLVVVCFDGDAAGQRAAAKAMETALPMAAAERRIAFAELPAGMDPDDLIAQGGRQALEKAVGAALPLGEMIWRVASKDAVGSPESLGGAIQKARALAEQVGDPEVRRAFLRDIEKRGYQQGRTKAARVDMPKAAAINPAEAAVILGAALWPAYVEAADERLGMLDVASPLAAEVRESVLSGSFAGERADRQAAVLRSYIPHPAPSFIDHEDTEAWLASLRQREMAAKRRSRRPNGASDGRS